MTLPPISDKIWSDLIIGKTHYDFECLAIKILLGRVQVQVTSQLLSVESGAVVLYNFFDKNQQLPSAQRDLTKILEQTRSPL